MHCASFLEFKTIIVGIDIRPSLFVLITKYVFVPTRVIGTAQIATYYLFQCVCNMYCFKSCLFSWSTTGELLSVFKPLWKGESPLARIDGDKNARKPKLSDCIY